MTLQSHGSITGIRGGRAMPLSIVGRLCQTPIHFGWRFTETPYKNCSRSGETDDLLFGLAGDIRRRHESDFHVFLGAGHQVPTTTQVELVFDVLAMALDSSYAQIKRLRDLAVAKP